jgi:hypothetical protein
VGEIMNSLSSEEAREELLDAARSPQQISRAGVFRARVYKTVEPEPVLADPEPVLVVMHQAPGQDGWQVYGHGVSPREPDAPIRTIGPIAGTVKSWADLADLSDQQGLQSYQVTGAGLAEMEDKLGPRPE